MAIFRIPTQKKFKSYESEYNAARDIFTIVGHYIICNIAELGIFRFAMNAYKRDGSC